MVSKITCPKCRAEIPLEDVNVATDIVLCRQCGHNWSYADLVADARVPQCDPQHPPRGAWFREMPPRGFEVGVSTRSADAFFLVPFILFWSGLSLGGIYGTQFHSGHFSLLLSLFGLPFLCGTFFLGAAAGMALGGKVVVRVNDDEGVIFTGMGPVGWRRCFNWRTISGIRRTIKYGNRGADSRQITFQGEKPLNFAADVKEQRLDFMLTMLRMKWREAGH
jgi:hypothetical protein